MRRPLDTATGSKRWLIGSLLGVVALCMVVIVVGMPSDDAPKAPDLGKIYSYSGIVNFDRYDIKIKSTNSLELPPIPTIAVAVPENGQQMLTGVIQPLNNLPCNPDQEGEIGKSANTVTFHSLAVNGKSLGTSKYELKDAKNSFFYGWATLLDPLTVHGKTPTNLVYEYSQSGSFVQIPRKVIAAVTPILDRSINKISISVLVDRTLANYVKNFGVEFQLFDEALNCVSKDPYKLVVTRQEPNPQSEQFEPVEFVIKRNVADADPLPPLGAIVFWVEL